MRFAMIMAFAFVGATVLMGCGSSAGGEGGSAGVAEASAAEAGVKVPAFSADSAYAHIVAQTAFGPRVPGTEAHRRCAEYLTGTLERYGVEVKPWRKRITDFSGNSFELVNIVGRINPEAKRRILLAAHWDSRRWADEDADPAKHSEPVTGANDGASGVAVILEMARVMSRELPGVGIDILLTDAEDSGKSAPEGADDVEVMRYENSWCLGTQHWLKSDPYGEGERPEFGILLDMVGAGGAVFPPEYYSLRLASHVVEKILAAARRAGTSSRFPSPDGRVQAINDDHVHLNGYGIPTADIIDIRPGGFNPHWHTSQDTAENIDLSTLGDVGRTVLNLIYNE